MIELALLTEEVQKFLDFHPTEQGNAILQDIRTTYYYEIRLVLIFNFVLKKYNAYLFDYIEEGATIENADYIVNNYRALSLEEANKCFTTYQFSKNNYGFSPVLSIY